MSIIGIKQKKMDNTYSSPQLELGAENFPPMFFQFIPQGPSARILRSSLIFIPKR